MINKLSIFNRKLFLSALLVSICFLLSSNASAQSAYYWVGGSGGWSDLTHWSTTSGGAGNGYGQSPTSTDTVYFDAASGASFTCDLGGSSADCATLHWSADNFSSISSTGSSVFQIHGSADFQVGAFSTNDKSWSFFNGIMRFMGDASGNGVIDFQGLSLGSTSSKVSIRGAKTYTIVSDMGNTANRTWNFEIDNTANVIAQAPLYLGDFTQLNVASFTANKIVEMFSYSSDKSSSVFADSVFVKNGDISVVDTSLVHFNGPVSLDYKLAVSGASSVYFAKGISRRINVSGSFDISQNSLVNFAAGYVYEVPNINITSAQLIANNVEMDFHSSDFSSIFLTVNLEGISAALQTEIKNSVLRFTGVSDLYSITQNNWVDCSGTQVYIYTDYTHPYIHNLRTQSLHLIGAANTMTLSNSSIDSVICTNASMAFDTDTANYVRLDSMSSCYMLENASLQINSEMHVASGVSFKSMNVSGNPGTTRGSVYAQPGAKLFLGDVSACSPNTILKLIDFYVSAASDVTASNLFLENSNMYDFSTLSSLSPPAVASNSTQALASVNNGWSVGAGTGNTYYWVGSIPADTTNEALYGDVNDPNNWSTVSTDQPGSPNTSGNTCLPSVIDSLVFKTSSYVKIQNNIDWGTVNITGFLITNTSPSFDKLNVHGSFYNHNASTKIYANQFNFNSDVRVNNFIGADQPFEGASNPTILFTTSQGSAAPTTKMSWVSDFFPSNIQGGMPAINFERGNYFSQGFDFTLTENTNLSATSSVAHSVNDNLFVDFRNSNFKCGDYCYLNFVRDVNVKFNAPDSIYYINLPNSKILSTSTSLRVLLYSGDSINYIETPGTLFGELYANSNVGKMVVGDCFAMQMDNSIHVGNLYLVNNPLTVNAVTAISGCTSTAANPVLIDTILAQASLKILGGFMHVKLFNLPAAKNVTLTGNQTTITTSNGLVGGSCAGLANVIDGTFTSALNQNVSYINLTNNTANGGGTFTYNNGTADAATTGWNVGSTLTARVLYWVGGTGQFDDNTHWSLQPNTMLDDLGGNSTAEGNCPPTIVDDVHVTPGSFTTTNDTIYLVNKSINVHALYMNGQGTLYANTNVLSSIDVSGDVTVGDSIIISTAGTSNHLERLNFTGSDSTHVYVNNNQSILNVTFSNTDPSKYYQVNMLGSFITSRIDVNTGIFDFNTTAGSGVRFINGMYFDQTSLPLTVRLNNSLLSDVGGVGVSFNMAPSFNFDAGVSTIMSHIIKTNTNSLRLYNLIPLATTTLNPSVQNANDYIHLVSGNAVAGATVDGFSRIDSVITKVPLVINNSKFVGDVVNNMGPFSPRSLNMSNIDSLGTYKTSGTDACGTLTNINYARYIEHSSATTDLMGITLDQVAVDTFIMNADRAVYADTVKIHKLMDWKFGSRQVADPSSLLWLDNSSQFSAMGTGGNEIYWQLSTNNPLNQAYVRKDSGQLCADFIYMRGIQAIGNGTYPAAGGNPTIDTMLASSFYPTVATSGRAIFTAGANADNQGQNAGWDFSAYPPYPDAVPDLNNIIACSTIIDTIYIPIKVLGSFPFELNYWYVYSISATLDTLKIDTIPPDLSTIAGSGTVADPYIFNVPIPKHSLVYPLGANIPFGLTQISSDRCTPVSTALNFKTTLSGLGVDESFAFDSVLETSITNNDVKIKFSIVNDGALAIVGKIPVAMYNAADTSLLGLLWTDSSTTLKPGDTSVFYTITGSGIKNLGNFQVLLYLNSNGGGQLGTQFGECSYVGNVFKSKLLKITAQDDYDTVAENSTSNVLNVLANDQYFDSTFTGLRVDSIWHQPKFGSIVSYDSVIRYNAPSIALSGGVDTLGYYVGDEFGRVDSAMVYITLDTSACVSYLNDDYANIWKGSSQEIRVRDNDVKQQSITGIDVSRLRMGSAVLNGDSTITYISDGTHVGVDSIIYYTNGACLDSAWLYVAVLVKPDWEPTVPCNLLRPATDFHIQLKQASTLPVHSYGGNIVGDMNGDGIPEIVVASSHRPVVNAGVVNGAILADSMVIFNGKDLNKFVEFYLPAPYIATGGMALARGKIGGVDTTLLIVALQDKYLYAYNSAGVQVWKSNAFYTQDTARFRNVKVSVADIMGNGNIDIVADNGIFSFDGTLLLTMDTQFPVQQENWDAGGQNSYALADVTGDKKLEYICASEVYKLNVSNYAGTVGNTINLYSSLPGFKLTRVIPARVLPTDGTNTIDGVAPGNTAVVDMTGDGNLDVVVNNVNGLYVWSPSAGTGTLIDSVALPMMRFATPFTGDIDGSHISNILYCSIDSLGNKFVLSYKFNRVTKKLSLFWELPHTDVSGATGMTLFDFNADGIMEICYRDENNLRIINGSMKSHLTGADTTVYNYATFKSGSATQVEYPTVADVDGSGSANLIVVGNASGLYSDGTPATLNVYSSVTPGAWAWARPVWNQYMYNAINVNQDLTIPQVQVNSAMWVLKDSVANAILPVTGTVADSVQPYNSFFQQHSLESAGKYVMVGSALAIGTVTQAPNATNDSITFTIPFTNAAQLAGYPATDSAIAFYCGDSSLHQVLWVGNMPSIGVWSGKGSLPTDTAVVTIPISALSSCSNSLTVVLNDRGNGTGDTTLPGECSYTGQAATVCVNLLENDYVTVHLGSSKEIRVRDNDSIQQSISYINTSLLQFGTAVLNGDSTVTYTSDSTSQGIDSLAYITSNAGGCLDSAWVVITILPNDTLIPNPNGAGGIGANAVVWNRKDLLTTYNGIMVVDTAHVEAYDSLTHYVPRAQIYLDTIKYNYILSRDTVGIYPMTYYMPGGLGAPEYTLVFDNDSITPNPTPGLKEAIGADNYTWNIRNLTNLNLTTSRDTAHVTAMGYDSTFIPRTSIVQDGPQFNTILAQTAPIVLPLTYTTPKGTSVHINVFLTGDSTGGGPIGADTMITASNFTWKIKNLSTLTDSTSRDSSKVYAIDSQLHSIPQAKIQINVAELASVKAQTTSVVMPLSYRTGTKVVHVNVFLEGDSTNGPPTPVIGSDTIITASNFSWNIKQLSSLTDLTSRDSSKVAAIDTLLHLIPQNEIFIDTTELISIQAQTLPALMPLSYSTGTKVVHINVFLRGDSSNYPIDSVGKDTIITANNFTWKLKNLAALTDSTSRDSSGVMAFDSLMHVIPQSEIFVNAGELANIKAQTISVVMPLSYRTGTKVVHVNVFLEGDSTNGPPTPVIGTDTIITASNFSWNIKQLSSLTDLTSRDSSKVAAIDTLLHLIPQNEIFIDTTELISIQAQTLPALMPLSYSTGTKVVHINVFLRGDSSNYPIDSVGKDTIITANNFTWKLKNLAALTDSTSRDSSGVMAFDSLMHVIPQSEIFVNAGELANIKAQNTSVVMPLSYRTGTKVVHVNVFLEGDSTNGPPTPVIGTDTIITASNFSWNIKQLSSLTDLTSRDSSKVAAIDTLLHLIPQNEIFIDTTELISIQAQTLPALMPLSYSTGTKVVHINVFLRGDSSNYPIDSVGKDTIITANNFTWKLKNLAALTDSTSRDSSGVMAFDSLMHVIPQSEIFVNAGELANIKAQNTSVVMPLSYTTGTKVVHVNVFLEGDSTNGPPTPVIGTDTIITASNFSWNIKQLSSLTDLTSRDSSKVAAIDTLLHLIPQNEIFIDTTELISIQAQTLPALMPLSYSTGTKVVHINVFLRGDSSNYPIDSVGKDTIITASNFSWMVKDLPSLTDASSRISSGVAAIDSALRVIPQSEIFINNVELANIKAQTQSAVMPLSYRTGTHVVHINVTLWATDTVAPSPNGGIGGIGADVVVWKLKDLSNYTQAIAPDTAHVVAFYSDGTTVPRSLITTDTVKYNYIMSQDTVGFFPMTYISPDTFVTDYVIVLDNDTITPNPTGREVIGADDYIWPLRKRANINAATAKKAAKVSAYHYDGTVIPRGNITANAVDLNALRAMTTSGSDSLTFSTPGNITSTRIKVTLVDNDTTTIDSITGEAIGANNFAWNIRNLNTLTKNISKDTAHVNAEYRDGRKIPRSSLFVNGAQFATITAQTTPGVWPLTYTTPDGVSVTVNVALLDNDSIHVDPVKDEVIGADNFAFYVESLDTLDNVVARDTAHTKAFNMITGAEILRNTLLVDPTMLSVIKAQTDVIVLPLKFTTPNGTPVTINVTLMVDSTGTYSPDCHEYIYGKNFAWGIDSVNQLSDSIIRAYGKIGGIYTDGSGKPIAQSNITLNANDIAAAQAIGVADTGVYIHFSTNSSCKTTDSLRIYITSSSAADSDLSVGFIVSAVPLQLCDSNLCDVDENYENARYWGVDTMKYHATLFIKMKGTYNVDATVSLTGVPTSLYTTSLPSNGMVHLVAQGNESVASVEIYRDQKLQPNFGGLLKVNVKLSGISRDVHLKFSNDFDGDGIANEIERSACIKKTHGVFNEWYFNSPYDDADGDGIADIVEAHGNMDSLYTTFTLPGACIPDFQNDDANGDGVPDDNEKYTDNTNDTINNRDIHVRPAVSPNGDGLGDDQMFIENINFYPQNTVVLFDRVGHVIYKQDGYNNKDKSFKGYPNEGSNANERVPMGTYYYYVKYFDPRDNKNKTVGGFIEVRY